MMHLSCPTVRSLPVRCILGLGTWGYLGGLHSCMHLHRAWGWYKHWRSPTVGNDFQCRVQASSKDAHLLASLPIDWRPRQLSSGGTAGRGSVACWLVASECSLPRLPLKPGSFQLMAVSSGSLPDQSPRISASCRTQLHCFTDSWRLRRDVNQIRQQLLASPTGVEKGTAATARTTSNGLCCGLGHSRLRSMKFRMLSQVSKPE